jgi:hypothetical protein
MPHEHDKSSTYTRYIFERYMKENQLRFHQDLADHLGVSRQVLQNWMIRDGLSKKMLMKVSGRMGVAYPINRIKGVGAWAEERAKFSS